MYYPSRIRVVVWHFLEHFLDFSCHVFVFSAHILDLMPKYFQSYCDGGIEKVGGSVMMAVGMVSRPKAVETSLLKRLCQ